MATNEELQAEVDRLTAELTNVQKGPQWRNLERDRDNALAETDRYKGLFDTARTQLVSSAVQIAGFKPNEKGEFEGVERLLVKEFTSGLGDEDLPDPTAFVALTEQYGYKPAAPAGGENGAGGQGAGNSDLAAQIAALQAGGDQLGAAGSAPRPADLDAQISAAEASGDVQASMALKAQKLRAMASL